MVRTRKEAPLRNTAWPATSLDGGPAPWGLQDAVAPPDYCFSPALTLVKHWEDQTQPVSLLLLFFVLLVSVVECR